MILGAMMLVDSPLPELRVERLEAGPGHPGLRGVRDRAGAAGRPGAEAPRRRPGPRASWASAAQAETDLDPEGWVIVQGERWRARAGERIASGETVEVLSVEGLRLRVRKGA